MPFKVWITYDLKDPRHFDFDLNEAYVVENEQRPAADERTVHAEIQADWPVYAIHGRLPNVLEYQNDEILLIEIK